MLEQFNDLKKLKLTLQQRDYYLLKIKLARNLSQQKITEKLEKYIIKHFEELVGFFPSMAIPMTFGDCFQRLVINKDNREDKRNKRLFDYSQIKYPPKDKEKFLNYNRASLKEQAVFYGGFGELAIALEAVPKLGNLITTSKWKQKIDMPLRYLPIFYKQEVAQTSEFEKDWNKFIDLINNLDSNLSLVLIELLDFMTEVFTKPVNKGNKNEYLFSALFSNYYLTNPHSNVQCLYYPSVPCNFASSNIACLPQVLDSYFECMEVIEVVIIQAPDNYLKGWLSIKTGKAVEVNAKAIGEISWVDTKSKEEMLELKNLYEID